MSSALKPALTPTGAQNPPVPSQLNKPMHPQGAPTTYGQPMSHIPQNLVNIPHNAPSSTNVHNPAHSNAHSVPHHINTNAHATSHSANHYSLSVPNASSQHYPVSGNAPVSSHSAPVSNHPVANPSQSHTQSAPTFSSPPKNLTYNPNYQANLGHSYKPTNATSTQNPSVSQPQAVTATPEESASEKPQSNGTPEVKTTSKPEPPQNHISTSGIKDKPPPPPPPAPPQSQAPTTHEKAKTTPEKSTTTVTVSTTELKQNADINKSSEVINTSAPSDKHSASTGLASLASTTSSSNPASSSTLASSSNVPLSTVTTPSSVAATAPISGTTSTVAISTAAVQPTQPTVSTSLPEPQESQDSVVTATATINNKPKEQINQKSTLKLATTPRTPVRKAKTPKPETSDSSKSSKTEKAPTQKSPGSGKTKRTRTRTQPYQSPLPEVEMISKISVTTPRNKSSEDKLIIFYKNEFLAVRNSEGGFYVCQAVQNIYKSSPRIRIRWLSQDKNDKEIYTPDFYDYTDFDCILTNLNLGRVDKGKYKLPANERVRTDSILKRALAVEKGDATPPSLTEEHPDGLDLSLYKEESQLKKRKSGKRKASTPLRAASNSTSTRKSPDQPKVRKIVSKPKSPPVKKSTVLKRALSAKVKKIDVVGRAERAAKRRYQEPPKHSVKTSPIIDQKKAKVLAKVARKTPVGPPPKPQPLPKQNTKIVKQAASSSSKKPAVAKKEKPIVTRKSKRGKK